MSAASLLLPAGASVAVDATPFVSLQADNFEHIQFRKIKANRYYFQDQTLQIDVDNSASFLMLPFAKVKKVSKVSFQWRSEGLPQIKNAQHELKRDGDDAVFKLGLLLRADDDPLNPFVPPWLKQVRQLLKFPSEEITYLVAGAKHRPGEHWPNPYNRRVTMISVASTSLASTSLASTSLASRSVAGTSNDASVTDESEKMAWQQSSYQFEQALDVVAIWLMSDGDNTSSHFTAHVKNIKIE